MKQLQELLKGWMLDADLCFHRSNREATNPLVRAELKQDALRLYKCANQLRVAMQGIDSSADAEKATASTTRETTSAFQERLDWIRSNFAAERKPAPCDDLTFAQRMDLTHIAFERCQQLGLQAPTWTDLELLSGRATESP
ncbi:MAG: hypothetical protein EPN60_17000 [Nevskiaceae bacterium]|nr:MAG: hypothetical protein EPN60_17000 [Nevskiaceae bacterium]